jgi:hypothetical protein
MGCWDNVTKYLETEAERYSKIGLPRPDLNVKLRLDKDKDVPIRMKIGLAKMDEKRSQFMIKFSTVPTATKTIQGIDKEGKRIPIEGKPRGRLVACDHVHYFHELTFNAYDFAGAVHLAYNFMRKKEGIGLLRYPSWLSD